MAKKAASSPPATSSSSRATTTAARGRARDDDDDDDDRRPAARSSSRSSSSSSDDRDDRRSSRSDDRDDRRGSSGPGIAEIRSTAELLKQVSDPTRLQVLLLLSRKELNVTEICQDLPKQSQPSVSHHLALLRHGRLIEPRRAGKHNYYSLTEQGRRLSTMLQNLV